MANTVKKLSFAVPVADVPTEAASTSTVNSTTGGTISSSFRYYLRYAWVTASGETMMSAAISASITPPSTGYKYNIVVPTFPAGVTSVNIYACSFSYEFSSVFDTPETATYYLQGNSATTTFVWSNYASATQPPTVDTSGLYNTVAYTVPASTKAIVKNIKICNTTDKPAKINIAVRVSGSSYALNKNIRVVSEFEVSPRNTIIIEESLVLEAAETILAQQRTANALTLHISGVEVA